MHIGLGICLQQHLAEPYQQRFQQRFAASEAGAIFWGIVEDHHKAAYQGLRQLEKFKQCLFEPINKPEDEAIDEVGKKASFISPLPSPLPEGEGAQCHFINSGIYTMREYFENLCATGMNSGSDPAQQRALRLQCRTVSASFPDTIWNSELKALAYPLYATAYEAEIRTGQWPERKTCRRAAAGRVDCVG